MSARITGFLLVRRPSENFDKEIIGYPTKAPSRDQVLYEGVTRLPWSDLDGAIFGGTAAPTIKSFMKDLRHHNADSIGLSTWPDYDEIRRVDGLVPGSHRREIIAIYSDTITEVKGSVRAKVGLQRLGFDTFLLGSHSLIFDGVFLTPEFDRYSSWFQMLNRHGLFDDRQVAIDFGVQYAMWSTNEAGEPLDLRGIDILDVYRVEE